jgi:hypothetical protein
MVFCSCESMKPSTTSFRPWATCNACGSSTSRTGLHLQHRRTMTLAVRMTKMGAMIATTMAIGQVSSGHPAPHLGHGWFAWTEPPALRHWGGAGAQLMGAQMSLHVVDGASRAPWQRELSPVVTVRRCSHRRVLRCGGPKIRTRWYVRANACSGEKPSPGQGCVASVVGHHGTRSQTSHRHSANFDGPLSTLLR